MITLTIEFEWLMKTIVAFITMLAHTSSKICYYQKRNGCALLMTQTQNVYVSYYVFFNHVLQRHQFYLPLFTVFMYLVLYVFFHLRIDIFIYICTFVGNSQQTSDCLLIMKCFENNSNRDGTTPLHITKGKDVNQRRRHRVELQA